MVVLVSHQPQLLAGQVQLGQVGLGRVEAHLRLVQGALEAHRGPGRIATSVLRRRGRGLVLARGPFPRRVSCFFVVRGHGFSPRCGLRERDWAGLEDQGVHAPADDQAQNAVLLLCSLVIQSAQPARRGELRPGSPGWPAWPHPQGRG